MLTVVGVTPSDFAGTYAGLAFDVWIPLTMEAAVSGDARAIEDRDFRWLQVFGRLHDEKSLAQARAELIGISRRLSALHAGNVAYEAYVKPLDTGAAQRLRALFTVLLCMTGLIAAIVCTNVANLLMLVGSKRSAELRIRLSLGATPRQLAVQLLTESLLLALGGAATGLRNRHQARESRSTAALFRDEQRRRHCTTAFRHPGKPTPGVSAACCPDC